MGNQINAEMSGLTLVNDTAHTAAGGAGLVFAPSVAFQNNGVLAINA